jgi:hypothetical protein
VVPADDALQLTASSTSGSESESSSGAGGADTAGSITALTSLSSTDESSSSSGLTMAERMQQQFEQKQNASTEVVAFKQRQQRRKDYMEQQGQVGVGGWSEGECCFDSHRMGDGCHVMRLCFDDCLHVCGTTPCKLLLFLSLL